MNRRKSVWGILLLFCCLFAAPAMAAKAASYTIQKYEVDMLVTRENTYQIQEKITVFFESSQHGIYRDIPIVNNVERTDGSSDRIIASISNISCGGENYTTSREGTYCRITIGDENETIKGEKTYTISYDYEMGKDVLSNEDELYFNIIGNGWETTISNVTFRIEMPDDFDEENLSLSYGLTQSTESEGMYYYREGNVIYGELDSDITLNPYEGIGVHLTLPEGYFEYTVKKPALAFMAIALAVITVLTAFLLWWFFGRDDPVEETAEYYPPDGMNSLELAFAYRGKVKKNDVVSLLVYLAQKGYLQIETDEGGKEFTLIKKKDYDGSNRMEEVFMNNLFSEKDIVFKKDLVNSFYGTIYWIQKNMNSRENREKLFYTNSLNKGWILYVLSIAGFLLSGYIPAQNCGELMIGIFVLMAVVGICLMVGIRMLFVTKEYFEGYILIEEDILICTICALGVYLYVNDLHEVFLCANSWYCIAYYIAIAAGIIAMFFCSHLSKRTPYGLSILGRIRGFKTYLETVEKSRLEEYVTENPQYFYDILPYTYVLGISSKWMKRFESIKLKAPAWYVLNTSSVFHVAAFQENLNTMITSISESMISSPDSGAGGSSGGGFSGGGSGGGGGGSW